MDLGSALVGALPVVVLWAVKEFFAPDLLDRRKQRRAAELQRAADQRTYEREDAPIRARIMGAALDLLRSFERLFTTGEFSLGEWQHLHDKLYSIVDCESGARALGTLQYMQMMDVLIYDQLSINVQSSAEAADALTIQRVGTQHDERYRNVAAPVLRFIGVLDAIGYDFLNDKLRTRLTALATAHVRQAPLSESAES